MRSTGEFRAGIIQMRCTAEPAANRQKAVELIRGAADRGAQVICTQELFSGEYFCRRQDPELFDLAEPVPGPSTQLFGKLAAELHAVLIISLFERRAPGVYHNSAAVLDADGALLGVYRKMHIPDDPLYYEKYYFTPGDLGFQAFATRYGRIGVLVCWDQWFPEAARITAMQEVSILFYPTAIGWHPAEKAEFGKDQVDAWQTIQRAHAIANGVYVAAPNRVGHEGPADGGLDFFGNSFICDPFGRFLAKASSDCEEILIAEIDPRCQETVRRNWPFFRDRRIDCYGPLLERFRSR